MRISPRSAAPRPSRSLPGWLPVTGRQTRPSCPGWPAPIRHDTEQHTPQPRGKHLSRKEVRASTFYWERHPDGPFATLIAMAATYCTPEAYDDLISRARAPEPDDEEIRAFNAELQQALADTGQLPGNELFQKPCD
jgi:hypothetical protein